MITSGDSATPPMPKEIAKAVAEITGRIGVLAKQDRNEHGGYNYTNVDKVFEAVGPLCTEIGLIILSAVTDKKYDKIETERGAKVAVTLTYKFTLVDVETGANWSDPEDRPEVRMWWTGAQTYGAAQSYAIKQYMRGLFKIATGDRDADEADQDIRLIQEETRYINTERKGRGRPPTSKIIAFDVGGGKQGVALDEVKEKLFSYLDSLSRDQLRAWKLKNADAITTLHGMDKNLSLSLKELLDERLG